MENNTLKMSVFLSLRLPAEKKIFKIMEVKKIVDIIVKSSFFLTNPLLQLIKKAKKTQNAIMKIQEFKKMNCKEEGDTKDLFSIKMKPISLTTRIALLSERAGNKQTYLFRTQGEHKIKNFMRYTLK